MIILLDKDLDQIELLLLRLWNNRYYDGAVPDLANALLKRLRLARRGYPVVTEADSGADTGTSTSADSPK